jgi:hypothetical protein
MRAPRAPRSSAARTLGKQGLRDLQQSKVSVFWLEQTSKMLTEDVDRVFKKRDVVDPGILQLMGLDPEVRGGFFSPDPEGGKTGKLSETHGFTEAFFTTMASKGFEVAACWEKTPDLMHFELVEGRALAESGEAEVLTPDPEATP